MIRRLKSLVGRLVYVTGLYRLFFRDKAVVVLFHRVDDRLATNPISCSRETFTSFCDFFKHYFIVVSLEELVAKLERGEDVSRHLCITFDDGYRDNHDIAALELRKRDLTACFFIATGFIGSKHIPHWDASNGIESSWMDWDQVRQLTAQGFEVGAHTVNHVDLGVVVGEEASREIRESKRRLEQEVGADIPFFSYPFGGRQNICDDNLERVRREGFRCCLAAYGGTVVPDHDPWYLERMPISPWYVSPYHFGWEAIRERPVVPLPRRTGADG